MDTAPKDQSWDKNDQCHQADGRWCGAGTRVTEETWESRGGTSSLRSFPTHNPYRQEPRSGLFQQVYGTHLAISPWRRCQLHWVEWYPQKCVSPWNLRMGERVFADAAS